MTAAPADLVAHLARFARALRERSVAVSLSDEADGLAALTLVDLGDRDEVRRALRAALKVRPRDLAAFEELFARLWSAREPAGAERPRNPPVVDPARPAAPRHPAPPPSGPGAATPGSAALREGEEPGWSPEAILRRKPFEECSAADLAAMERLLARLALSLATRRSRRRVPVRGRGEVDLRRSFRRAVAQGGEFRALARRARPVERPRLVVLCDTSGSMDPHARFFLAFVLALRQVARSSEVFAFNTALVRLTPSLRSPGPAQPGGIEAALARLAAAVPDWSGGTRIGECLADFAARYLDPLVDSDTVVLILSDGLDRGDLAPLAAAMCAIRARARRVLWLNPLAGDPRYEPTARAMAAALPYLDRLLPAHDLESLARLLPLLTA
jgi:uncharacterized protein with von Willebrand factor type A (vWA) domain